MWRAAAGRTAGAYAPRYERIANPQRSGGDRREPKAPKKDRNEEIEEKSMFNQISSLLSPIFYLLSPLSYLLSQN
jgi:ribosomal protein L4